MLKSLFFIMTILIHFKALSAFANQSNEDLYNKFPQSCYLFQGKNTSQKNNFALEFYKINFRKIIPSHDSLNNSLISIRDLKISGQEYLLVVHLDSNQTALIDFNCTKTVSASTTIEQLGTQVNSSKYVQTLKIINQNYSQKNNDSGLTNSSLTKGSSAKGYFLSVDLCPSKKNLNYEIFENPKTEKFQDFPVAIAITGGWINHHEGELNWLKDRTLNGQLNTVWVNHSLTHPYIKGLQDNKNFLLMNKENFNNEVLDQEKTMIENGLTPSVFFRFPGLISDSSLIQKLTEFGLITLGSDAWLGLGQKAKNGSVILIHGNGNEPSGVHLFLNLLDTISDLGVFKALNTVL